MPIRPNQGGGTETDPIYTEEKPLLALKSEIPDTSALATKTELQAVKNIAIAMAVAL